MKSKTKSLFLGVLLTFLNYAEAQFLFKNIDHNRDSVPIESIYLHTNQDGYVAGETIWFKAYLYSDFNSSAISTNLFVDLLNENNSLILSKKLPVFGGASSGQIDLPDTLSEAVYLIRAYTVRTLNLGENYLFQKAIPVFNPGKKNTGRYPAPSNFTCLFFPESGRMINSIPNRVAFKAINDYLQPVKVKGIVTDSKGYEVAEFSCDETGLGSFNLTPKKGDDYFAKIEFENGSIKEISLPAAKDEGVILNVGENAKGKLYSVSALSVAGTAINELYLLAILNEHIIANQKIQLINGEAQGLIPVEGLPEGLLQIILLDNEKKLVASRVCFIKDKKKPPVHLKTDTLQFSKKGLQVFTLFFDDSLKGNFSISITDPGALPEIRSNKNIIQGLLQIPGNTGIPVSPEKGQTDLQALTTSFATEHPMRKNNFRDGAYLAIEGELQYESRKKDSVNVSVMLSREG